MVECGQTDPVVRERLAAKAAAIVPVGSVEQHGAHLPVSTDSDIVGAVSAAVGRELGFLVTPTITTGVSFEHRPFFNISIRPSTLGLLLDDVCDSLYGNGIGDVFVINGHYGNRTALAGFARGRRGRNPRVHALSYWRFFKHGLDHAGFVETSLMLAVSGNVWMDLAQKGLVTDGMTPAEVQKIKELAARSFPAATGNGVWGIPGPPLPMMENSCFRRPWRVWPRSCGSVWARSQMKF